MKASKLRNTFIVGLGVLYLPFSQIHADDDDDKRYFNDRNITYKDFVKIKTNRGVKGKLAPQVRITSPLNAGIVAPGEGVVGAGSLNGTGFAINLEVLTRDGVGVQVNEATQTPADPGIRNVDALGSLNPKFPGLFVFINKDLITPTGEIIPKNTNLGPLFNVAGSDDTPGNGVTVWAGWHVLESLPPGTDQFTIEAAVLDNKGRIGFDKIRVNVDNNLLSGNALTPGPLTYPGTSEINSAGPLVEIIAPRVPSAIALGDQVNIPNAQTGSLNFIQVNVLDIHNAGIAVDELGETVTKPELGPGSILDPTQLTKGPNRNFPGLNFTFDVPLLAPTGLLVSAGENLAPVFNIVGSEIDPNTGATRVIADWVVGGSLIVSEGKEFVTFTAIVTDNEGNAGQSKRTFRISETENGQQLTPAPKVLYSKHK